MKKILILAALIIATTSSRAAGYISYDPSDSGTTSLSGGNALGENNISTGMSITLTNFKGLVTENLVVDLSWATMMESGVSYFAIERSADGINFEDIDSVKSKMSISTHDYQLQYSYADAHPLAGMSYYRVEVVGKNGYHNQSPVIIIKNSQAEGTKIYPTIIQNNMVFVESDKNLRSAKLEFFDLSGKKISETNWATLIGTQNTQVSMSGSLPTGTYLARLTANGQNVKTQLLIVQGH
ncbi:MAG TPA: T9SS type A sorting domain-containing protein [Puia sp.]